MRVEHIISGLVGDDDTAAPPAVGDNGCPADKPLNYNGGCYASAPAGTWCYHGYCHDGGSGGGEANGQQQAPACKPLTCEQAGAQCGTAPDSCGGTISCGECMNGTKCGDGGPNRCGATPQGKQTIPGPSNTPPVLQHLMPGLNTFMKTGSPDQNTQPGDDAKKQDDTSGSAAPYVIGGVAVMGLAALVWKLSTSTGARRNPVRGGWEHKAADVVSKLSYQSWYQANHDKHGHRYKRHHPYSIPEEAEELVRILGMHDRRAAEIQAKEIMEQLRREGRKID